MVAIYNALNIMQTRKFNYSLGCFCFLPEVTSNHFTFVQFYIKWSVRWCKIV